MSAIEYHEHTLICDGPRCTATYGPFGVKRSLSALRERAAKEGWTYVPTGRGWRYDEDYCPKDKTFSERKEP